MKSQKLSIADNKAFVDRMHNDCSPQQEIRELTVNSIQSVMRKFGSKEGGVVTWDVDWMLYNENEPRKLCIVDNGDGIEGDNMELFLNHLSSGIQSRDASGDTNYGIGAKISALPLNKAGLIYQSWVTGSTVGNAIRLGLDSENAYAILPMNGKIRVNVPISSAPAAILQCGHGTKATMLGNYDAQDTLSTPDHALGGSKWLSRYLNAKFWSIPPQVSLYAREWADAPPREQGNQSSPNFKRKISGLGAFVNTHAEHQGVVELTNAIMPDGTQVKAKARWFILKEDAPKSAGSYMPSKGHIACLMNNNSVVEIYEPRYHTNSLMRFGVLAQHSRVFIMIEPDASTPNLTTTAGRDALKIGKYRMPWESWEEEFASKLPSEIMDLYSPDPNTTSIRDKLKKIHDFLDNIPTFAKMSKMLEERRVIKALQGDEDEVNGVFERGNKIKPIGPKPNPGVIIDPRSNERSRSKLEEAFMRVEVVDQPTNIRVDDFEVPEFMWVSETPDPAYGIGEAVVEEDGTCEMHDRFATYLPAPNMLRVNYDFRGFQHFLELMLKDEQSVSKRDIIIRQVMESFEITLAETVLGVRSLSSEGTWSKEDEAKALSPEALTATAMQRYHAKQVLARNINRSIGKRNTKEELKASNTESSLV